MKKENLRLSNQAIATLMVTLQKCILEQVDITDLLRDYQLETNSENQLVVLNPPDKLNCELDIRENTSDADI